MEGLTGLRVAMPSAGVCILAGYNASLSLRLAVEGFEVDAFTMADHQRYFFFQSMSTVGALLLLVVHGPGKLSLDEQQGQLVLASAHDA